MAVFIRPAAVDVVLRSLKSTRISLSQEVQELQDLIAEGCACDFDEADLLVVQDSLLLVERLVSHVNDIRKNGGAV